MQGPGFKSQLSQKKVIEQKYLKEFGKKKNLKFLLLI